MNSPSDAPFRDASYGVDDVPYVAGFMPYLAPAWLDHVALLAGLRPPDRKAGFSWCDLGCGQGVTATVLATTHPDGSFHGVDMMAGHIDHARRLADEADAPNARFHTLDFAAADRELPRFDYIVSHGVYAWVGAETKAELRHFIDRHLKPGGLVYVSYNALPGWTSEMPFQRLIRALGETLPGDSVARFSAAFEVVKTLTAAGVPSLTSSVMVKDISANRERFNTAYLAHEYMGSAWQPLWVTEVREQMAEIGLMPAGSATLRDNYDSFVLGKAARDTVAAIEDDNVRELARDFFTTQWFRRDVFIRDGQTLEADERRRGLLDSSFALTRPVEGIEYATQTPAGRLAYDNSAARAVVAGLATGPARLADIAQRSGVEAPDILANALVLAAAGTVRPVEPSAAAVGDLNRAILRRLDAGEPIHAVALPCGTALQLERAILNALRDGDGADSDKVAAWRNFLATYGL